MYEFDFSRFRENAFLHVVSLSNFIHEITYVPFFGANKEKKKKKKKTENIYPQLVLENLTLYFLQIIE